MPHHFSIDELTRRPQNSRSQLITYRHHSHTLDRSHSLKTISKALFPVKQHDLQQTFRGVGFIVPLSQPTNKGSWATDSACEHPIPPLLLSPFLSSQNTHHRRPTKKISFTTTCPSPTATPAFWKPCPETPITHPPPAAPPPLPPQRQQPQ